MVPLLGLATAICLAVLAGYASSSLATAGAIVMAMVTLVLTVLVWWMQFRISRYRVWQEDGAWVAESLVVDVASDGATRDEAIANLKEAVDLYLTKEPRET